MYDFSDSVIGTRFINYWNIRSNRINSTEYRTPNILNTEYSPNICPTNSYNINFFTIRVSLSFVMPGLLGGICWWLRSTCRLLRGSYELLRCKFVLLRGAYWEMKYGWHTADIRRTYGWYTADIWRTNGWYTADIRPFRGWYTADIRLTYAGWTAENWFQVFHYELAMRPIYKTDMWLTYADYTADIRPKTDSKIIIIRIS